MAVVIVWSWSLISAIVVSSVSTRFDSSSRRVAMSAATPALSATGPACTARIARNTSSAPSCLETYAAAPAWSISAATSGEASAQQMTFVSGLTASRRRTSSAPDRLSASMPATTSSGRVRAETSTARRPSVTVSISSAAPDLIRTYWSCARPSGVSHTTTFVGIVFQVSADAGWG